MKISLPAYAKINLMLAVGKRRSDGYHDIESVMQTVSLHDTVTVRALKRRGNASKITLSCSDAALTTAENLAYRAARKYMESIDPDLIGLYDIELDIKKRIPIAAGLAGGSADCAATLIAMNIIYGLRFDIRQLCELGASLGADVPFCLHGGTRLVRGIGEIVTPCAPLSDVVILIVRSHDKISTAAAYSRLDEQKERDPRGAAAMLAALSERSIDAVAASAYNDFEQIISDTSDTARIKSILNESGATLAMMSGSGPSVFGIFTSREEARKAQRLLRRADFMSHICSPVEGKVAALSF